MALHPENEETVMMGAPPPVTPRPLSTNGLPRFAPGTLLARRYRIVSKLGKGGMGEVFRADDIVLGQTVALKFLPEAAHRNENLLARFYDEVRIARQISHANVCRVYDIGELEGQPYLSMEYIDGEDLSSLLRRIGRLPGDKAAELARKMCAGLGAAHAQGVLHRDIKPGNIMIDGRGEPRITDFGLAALGSAIEGNEIRNGTPAYMAPEQLEGREVSVQSDIYALGLVFHEMFTGKAAHEAATVAELTKLRRDSTTTRSSTVNDLDPAVERAIQACLQPDPKQRPKSALELARMLPGGDPLAAALAAGQTPSPEMVAASGSKEGIRPWVAAVAIAAVVVGLVVSLRLTMSFQIANLVRLEHPEVLESKARELIQGLGYTDPPADSVLDYEYDYRHRNYQYNNLNSREQWVGELQKEPTPFSFNYRQSPEPLVARDIGSQGEIQHNDPPLITSGMITVDIGMDGRLYFFIAVPPEKKVVSPDVKYDWAPLFAAAKLDPADFQETAPLWTPIVATDQRAAWTGIYPTNNVKVTIEAGAFQGKPVYFRVVWPWITPERTTAPSSLTSRRSITQNVYAFVSLLIAIAALLIARYNVKVGRVDFNGATRLAVFVFVTNMVRLLTRAHHSSLSGERALWGTALMDSISTGFYAWALYLALEPWIRRYWPQVMVTWSRALTGRWKDPLVGRDILIGVVAGVTGTIFILAIVQFDVITTGDYRVDQLLGASRIVEVLAMALGGSVGAVLFYLMLLLLLRLLLKRTWLAAVAAIALWCLYRGMAGGASQWWISALAFMPLTTLFMVVMVRYGFFAAVIAGVVIDASVDMMMTTNVTAWYGQSTLIMILLWLGSTAWGARLALGDRKLLDSALASK